MFFPDLLHTSAYMQGAHSIYPFAYNKGFDDAVEEIDKEDEAYFATVEVHPLGTRDMISAMVTFMDISSRCLNEPSDENIAEMKQVYMTMLHASERLTTP